MLADGGASPGQDGPRPVAATQAAGGSSVHGPADPGRTEEVGQQARLRPGRRPDLDTDRSGTARRELAGRAATGTGPASAGATAAGTGSSRCRRGRARAARKGGSRVTTL